jgi:UV DNA damage endonuclease
MRLGFPVKVLGQPGLKSHDTRRWQNHPHLSVSLAYLRDTFLYLHRQDIRMYRLASDLAPYASHPGLPEFHHQIEECRGELARLGTMAGDLDLRLSLHLPLSTILNAEDELVARQAANELSIQAQMLDAMNVGPEAVIVSHVGGIYGDRHNARARFVAHYRQLPGRTRRRLALENDGGRFSVTDLIWIHHQTGIPLILDYLHFLNHNPQGMEGMEALEACLRSWPPGVTPKIHFSSPRTAMRIVERRRGGQHRASPLLRAPRPRQHADFVDPFQFVTFVREARAQGLPDFDVMLEAKAKDLALLHLRDQMAKLAPELARRVE